jgi:lipoate-protein ligase A
MPEKTSRSAPPEPRRAVVYGRERGAHLGGALRGLGVHRGPPPAHAAGPTDVFRRHRSRSGQLDGRKVIGISKRRTRDGAPFQCLVLQRWDPAAQLELLTSPAERTLDELAHVAARRDSSREDGTQTRRAPKNFTDKF